MFGDGADARASPELDFGDLGGARLMGDYYCEPDDVCRGASLAAPFEFAYAMPDPAFWYESDEMLAGPAGMVKGIDMDFTTAERFHEGLDVMGTVIQEPNWLGDEPAGITDKLAGPAQPGIERFRDGAYPPDMPSDPLFTLGACTFDVASPVFAAGNYLLDFLDLGMTSSISKVNHRKFAIKAQVFLQGMACSLKIRAYRRTQKVCSIEFQRRGGDSLTFNSVYRQAVQYLLPRCTLVGVVPKAADEDSLQDGSMTSIIEESALEPIFDMAACTGVPEIQAEAAVALAGLTLHGQVAVSLCSERAIAAIEGLLQVEEPSVAHPTALLLPCLQKFPKARATPVRVPAATGRQLAGLVPGAREEAEPGLCEHARPEARSVPFCRSPQMPSAVLGRRIWPAVGPQPDKTAGAQNDGKGAAFSGRHAHPSAEPRPLYSNSARARPS